MQNDMQGIIEEQRVSRRQSRISRRGRWPARRNGRVGGATDNPPWEPAPWPATGKVVPALQDLKPVDIDAARRRSDQSSLYLRVLTDDRETGKPPSSTAVQRPARRRLPAAARPGVRQSLTGVLNRGRGGLFARFPVCHVAILAAMPVALMAIAVVLNTVVVSRAIVAQGVGVVIPSAVEAELLVRDLARGRGGNGEPLSINPSDYEKIRRTTYVVKPGDTISEIAYRFDLEPGTILSMNPIDDVRRLLPGTELSIPDRDGLFYAVQPGDSLFSIAAAHGISMSALVDVNDVISPTLQVGDALFVPGASMDEQDYLLAIGELFQWPVRNFIFTSGYGMRIHPITGVWHMHTGIDLANRTGTPILAAGSGRVVHVEDQIANYGMMIILDHGNGFKTLYGHLDSFGVSKGQWVSAGERIGTMGSSGRSTGPHLHFSVINGLRMEDPTRHLP